MLTLLATGVKYSNIYLQSRVHPPPPWGFCIMYQRHTLLCNLWLVSRVSVITGHSGYYRLIIKLFQVPIHRAA
jgi:hypothetical protein